MEVVRLTETPRRTCRAAWHRGDLQFRQGIHERRRRPAVQRAVTSSELVDALRELDMTTRREHPDCFPDDLIDRDAVERWLDELEERGRRFGDGRAATA